MNLCCPTSFVTRAGRCRNHAREDPKVAAWLTDELKTRVAAETARFVDERSSVATRWRSARRVSSQAEPVGDVPVVRIPLFSEEVSELEGLVRIAQVL